MHRRLKSPGNRIFAVVVAVLSAAGPSAAAPETLRISGSTTLTPIAAKAAERFRERHRGVRVFVSPTGSGAGIAAMASGTADIGMASREIDPDERKRFPKADFVVTPAARDAVVPVVSAAVYEAGVTALSLADLRRIYSGEAANWKAFGGPDAEILVIDKEASRGTRHVFMGAVFGDEKAKAPGARLVTGSNNEEQAAVSQSDAAIGMLSNAWMNERVRGLAIKTADGAVAPTLENVRSGRFPISRNLNFVTDGPPRGLAKRFIDFVLSPEGQSIVEELGYVAVAETGRDQSGKGR